MIEPRHPSQFYKRMKAARATGHDAEMAAEWAVAAFLRGIDSLEEPRAPRQLLTAEEVVSLKYVRFRYQRGEIEP